MKHFSLFYIRKLHYLCITKINKNLKNMKKLFITLLVFIPTIYADAQIQTTDADAETLFEENGFIPNKGPRRAPKKNVAPFEFYIDETSKTIRFSTSSEEQLYITINNSIGQLKLSKVLNISSNTDGIINLKSLDKGEYVIYIYNKGIVSTENFMIK